MGSINARADALFFDFRYQGTRCREYTKLSDTPANRKRMQKMLDQIEQEIAVGTFDYATYFPGSKLATKFSSPAASSARAVDAPVGDTPVFGAFVETWFSELTPAWRRSHAATVRSTIDRHLKPRFGEMAVGVIQKADVLRFRAELATLKGRGGNATLSPKSINRIIQLLSQVLAEAGERYGFSNPCARIKRLKLRRVDIQPFSLVEMQQMIEAIRSDYRHYLVVRFFTGLRTGELHGLQWKYVDFDKRQILVRETFVRGQMEYTKTDGSQREVGMSQPVYDALQQQYVTTGKLSQFVFCTRNGDPLDLDNVANRVWYPLLRHLGLEKRRPYQTRHTAATLWLGAGENPEWVARQLGHASTEMLFKTYARYIPNLTRRDGAAMDRLLATSIMPLPTMTSDKMEGTAPLPSVSITPTGAVRGVAGKPATVHG